MGWLRKNSTSSTWKANGRNELLLEVNENSINHGHYWIYDLTHAFPTTNNLDRKKWLSQVTYTLKQSDGMRVFVICNDSDMGNKKITKIVRGFIDGHTFVYRLD